MRVPRFVFEFQITKRENLYAGAACSCACSASRSFIYLRHLALGIWLVGGKGCMARGKGLREALVLCSRIEYQEPPLFWCPLDRKPGNTGDLSTLVTVAGTSEFADALPVREKNVLVREGLS